MKIIIEKLIQFFLIVLLGYFLAKRKYLGREALSILSRLITKVFLPAYSFCAMYMGNTRSQLFQGIPILGITLFFYLTLILLFATVAHIIGLKEERSKIFQALFIFGNTGFIGLPVIQSLYGGEGAIDFALFSIVDQIILWSYGIWLCNGGNGKFHWKKLINPCIISILVVIIFLLADIL